MSLLFSPLTIKDITFRNRIAVSPMCQYSSRNGFANDWHLVHLGTRAIGGAGLVMTEAAAVSPEGRISPVDLGIWDDAHIEMLQRITGFIHEHGAVAGIQLAHAGRKASVTPPWAGNQVVPETEGGWKPVSSSGVPFRESQPAPHQLSIDEIHRITDDFGAAAKRAREAGFRVLEIHGAHGYLLNEFLSPASNHRTDEYGGSFEKRLKMLNEIIEAIKKEWPERYPLFLRISASDWSDGGWTVDDSVSLARAVKGKGIDLIDCSSGANVPGAKIETGPLYQVPFAEQVKKESGMMTGAVGLITTAQQCEDILQEGKADIIFMARQMLRDPYFPLHAAKELGTEADWPIQYQRAK